MLVLRFKLDFQPPGRLDLGKAFHFKEKNVGILIGVVVLLACIAFVVLMIRSEWSESAPARPLAENPAPAASPRARRAPAAKKKAKR